MFYANFKKSLLTLLIFCSQISSHSQQENKTFEWPKTPASKVFQDFLYSYNTGKLKKIEAFIIDHYLTEKSKKNINSQKVRKYINENVDYWMDIFHRYGPVKPYAVSINQPYDLEVWLQGSVTKYWLAPEFILNSKTTKVKATGMLKGIQPKKSIVSNNNNSRSFIKSYKKYLSEVSKEGYFNGAVIVQKGDNVLLKESYGYKNLESKEKFRIDTRSNTASITKMLTTVACLQLVQNGILHLDVPVSKYLPELPKNMSSLITIRRLLNHTSGYELDGIKGFRKKLYEAKSIQEVYKTQLAYLPEWKYFTDFKLPTRFDYSNDSYDLVAVIIEKVTGMTFDNYLKKNIFEPAGMKNTSFEKHNGASYYRYDLEVNRLKKLTKNNHGVSNFISGAGGMYSTVEDLRLFFTTLFKTYKLLDLPHKSILFSPSIVNGTAMMGDKKPMLVLGNNKKEKRKNSRSAGLGISYDIVLNLGHNGTGIGSSSELRYFPEEDCFLVILSNTRSGSHIAYNYFKNILPKE